MIRIVMAGVFVVAATVFCHGAERPNFVIIMADDMGYGDSSVYNGWIKMPHMERMAREGMTFTDFHSSGTVCSPTRAGLMTGRYQERAGIPGVINADPKEAVHHTGLQTSETTFAELFRDAGYRTAIFGKWQVWEGGHRVPAVAWWPGKIEAGTKTDQLCISIDVMPTMLDIAKINAPDDRRYP